MVDEINDVVYIIYQKTEKCYQVFPKMFGFKKKIN